MKELYANAVTAIEALVQAQLSSGKAGRFDQVAKLCGYARALERMAALESGRVQPVRGAENGINVGVGGLALDVGVAEIMGQAPEFGEENRMYPLPRIGGPAADATDVIREVMSVASPLVQHFAAEARARAARERLGNLLQMREAAVAVGDSTENIDARLRASIAEGVSDALVSAEFLRGHPLGEAR